MIDKAAILDEVIRLTTPEGPPPYAFNRQEYMEKTGCSRSTAQNRLKKALEEGVVEGKKYATPFGEQWYYWLPTHQTNQQNPQDDK